jgi:hypothetical protein
MAINGCAGRIKQLNGVAGLVQDIGGPGKNQMPAGEDLRAWSDRHAGLANSVVVDLPAANRHGKRARIIELSPLTAAERVRHKLINHHRSALGAGCDVAR